MPRKELQIFQNRGFMAPLPPPSFLKNLRDRLVERDDPGRKFFVADFLIYIFFVVASRGSFKIKKYDTE